MPVTINELNKRYGTSGVAETVSAFGGKVPTMSELNAYNEKKRKEEEEQRRKEKTQQAEIKQRQVQAEERVKQKEDQLKLTKLDSQNAVIRQATPEEMKPKTGFWEKVKSFFGVEPKEESMRDVLIQQEKDREQVKKDEIKKLGGGVAESAIEGFQAGSLSLVSTAESAASVLARKVKAEKLAKKLDIEAQENRRYLQDFNQEYRQDIMSDKYSTLEKMKSTPVRYIAGVIGEASASTFAPLAVGAAASYLGAPVVAATGISAGLSSLLSFGSAYQDAREYGLDEGEAEKIGFMTALMTAPLDYIPEFRLFKKMGGKEIEKKIVKAYTKNVTEEILKRTAKAGSSALRQSVYESITESAQTVVENAWVRTYNQNRSLFEGVDQAALSGFFMGGMMDTLVSSTASLQNSVREKTGQEPGTRGINGIQIEDIPEQTIPYVEPDIEEEPVVAQAMIQEAEQKKAEEAKIEKTATEEQPKKQIRHGSSVSVAQIVEQGVKMSKKGVAGEGMYFSDADVKGQDIYGQAGEDSTVTLDRSKFKILTLMDRASEKNLLKRTGEKTLTKAALKEGYDGVEITNPDPKVGSTFVIANKEKLDSVIREKYGKAQASETKDITTEQETTKKKAPAIKDGEQIVVWHNKSKTGEKGMFAMEAPSINVLGGKETYRVKINPEKTKISSNQDTLYKELFKKDVPEGTFDYDKIDRAIAKKLKGQGYDTIKYTEPFVGNSNEWVILNKKSITESKLSGTRNEAIDAYSKEISETTQDVAPLPEIPGWLDSEMRASGMNTEQIRKAKVAHKKLSSRVYERLQNELSPEFREEVNYKDINLMEDAKKAATLIAKDKNKAYRVALGVDEAPAGQTATAVNIAMAEKALSDGNHALAAQLIKNRSLAQTRRGQEIVAEKGSISDNSTSRYVKEIVSTKLELLGKRYLEFLDLGKKASTKERAIKAIDNEVAKARKKIKSKEMDIQEAQSIIDKLSC